MNNYPEGADMSRVLDYPDYQPSEALGDMMANLKEEREEMAKTYPESQDDIDQWYQHQLELLESRDFWDDDPTYTHFLDDYEPMED